MVCETSKLLRWKRGVIHPLLTGRGIDVGCGDDPLPGCEPFDTVQGDANTLAPCADNTFDFLYSSHCFEHMIDLPSALRNWVRVVKPGGYLAIVVPDYEIYEHRLWPSRFNPDHKHTLSLTLSREKVGRENHWGPREIERLIADARCGIIEMGIEDFGFDYSGAAGDVDQTLGEATAQIFMLLRKSDEV